VCQTPGIPCALSFEGDAKAKLGQIMPREGFVASEFHTGATFNDAAIHLRKCGSMRIKGQCRRVASHSSWSRVASMIAARRGRLDLSDRRKRGGNGLARTLVYGADAALCGGRSDQHRLDHADLRDSDFGSADGAGRPQHVCEAEAAGLKVMEQRYGRWLEYARQYALRVGGLWSWIGTVSQSG
jgi:hypothetical protein